MTKIDYAEAYKLFKSGMTKEEIAKEKGYNFSTFNRGLPRWVEANVAKDDRFTESEEILKDGSIKATRLLILSDEERKSPALLMTAHGFDPDMWDLVSARNSVWSTYDERELYSSRVTVRPKKVFVQYDSIDFNVKPMEVTHARKDVYGGLLELPFTDMHWGNSHFEDYERTLEDTVRIIRGGYEKVVILIGSDMFHVDNVLSTTVSGTVLETTDLTKAYQDAFKFFSTLIGEALEHCQSVKLVYVKGNHDATFAWSFLQALKVRYPQVTSDDSFDMYKALRWNDIGLAFSHGNKQSKNVDRVIIHDFPWFAECKVREIHLGHYHRETEDTFGTTIRVLSTRNKIDTYTKDGGWRSQRRFQVFDYTPSELKAIYYV